VVAVIVATKCQRLKVRLVSEALVLWHLLILILKKSVVIKRGKRGKENERTRGIRISF
jgi:hypothetical protein